MLLSNITANPAACSVILDLKIPVAPNLSMPGDFYPVNARSATAVAPNIPADAPSLELPALALLLDAFVQGASTTTERKAPLHFLASVFANITTVSSFTGPVPPSTDLVAFFPDSEGSHVLLNTVAIKSFGWWDAGIPNSQAHRVHRTCRPYASRRRRLDYQVS